MGKPIRVLIVENLESDADLTVRILEKGGYDVVYERIDSEDLMRTALKEKTWDAVIADHQMLNFSAVDALSLLKENGFDIPFIVVSGTIGEDTAAALMKAGASDYLMKGDLARLVPALERELREAEIRHNRRRAEKALLDSEARFRQIFENISSGMIVYEAVDNGADFKIKNFNNAAEKIEQISRESVIGKTVCKSFPGIKGLGLFDVFQRVWKTGKMEHHPVSFYKDNRISGWRENHVAKLPSGEIVAVYDDVTEHKRAEKMQIAVYRISEAVHTDQDLNELYNSIHAVICELMPAKNFYIALYDASAELFHFPYHVDELDDDWRPISAGKSLTGHVLRTGKPLLATSEVFDQLVQSGQVEVYGPPPVDWLGVPLKLLHGETIGVMAVQTYTKDIRLCEADKDVLTFVSTQVAIAIERKLAEKALRESEEKYRNIFENIQDVYYEVGLDGTILEISPSIGILSHYKRDELIGKSLYDYYADPQARQKLLETIQVDGQVTDYEVLLKNGDGSLIPCSIIARLVSDDKKKPNKIVGSMRNISERKRNEKRILDSLKEKEVMLKEIHHRVKNNMQIMISLLRLQMRQIKNDTAQDILKESQDRIQSMALVHEALYRSGNMAEVELGSYIQNFSNMLYKSYATDPSRIRLQVDAEDVKLGIDQAVPCGLIVHELVSNVLKHAFPTHRKKRGRIHVLLRHQGDDIELSVKDNGIGLPEGIDFGKSKTLGMKLVMILADQLQAKIVLEKRQGTQISITFRADN